MGLFLKNKSAAYAVNTALRGTLHPIQDRKKRFSFFSCCANIYYVKQDLTNLAHKENTQSDIFLWNRLNILIAFCSLGGYPVSNV
jgi:hypothetical protein